MIKYIYSLFLGLFLISTQAQVGVNTDTPNSGVTLDVNGKTNVVQRINLGGTDVVNGQPGADKELIVSGGPDAKPHWGVKTLPAGFGDTFSMTYMHSGFDTAGADLVANGAIGYTPGMALNDTEVGTGTACPTGNCWKVLTGLNHTFPIYKNQNKVNFVFQTVTQINSQGSASYACGIFLNSTSASNPNPPLADYKLVGVRNDVVLGGTAGDYKLFNMNVTLENLAGSADGRLYGVRVACRGRTFSSNALVAGKPHSSQTSLLNSDMSRSSINTFVLENYQ